MDFVKKNLIMIISAAVSVLALVALVLGISQIDGVKQVLAKAQQEIANVNTILEGVRVERPGGQSVSLIPTEKSNQSMRKEIALRREQGLKTLRKALQENIGYDPEKKTLKRRPIMDGIFPKPVSDDLPFKFPQKYQEALAQLLTKMQAGSVPTEKEVLQEKESAAQDRGFLPSEEKKTATPAKPKDRAVRGNFGVQTTAIPTANPLESLEMQAILRAADKRARKIKVYCDLGGEDAKERPLDILSDVYTLSGGTPPPIEDMWWAQVSYWIQDDITTAIAETNASAANVLESPVKRILKVSMMHGYMVRSQNGNMEFAGRDEAQMPASFTNLGSDKYYDTVRFKVELVMDARQIPVFVDAMYRQSHYLLYHWEVESIIQPELRTDNIRNSERLYRYGTVPVVKLTTCWEGYLFRDFYHWGIVGYGVNADTGKNYVVLYNSDKPHELEDEESRKGLDGLMPKTIRQLLGSEAAEENTAGAGGGPGMGMMNQPAPRPSRSNQGGGSGGFGD